MVLPAKTYQYRLTQAECQLHNLLRRLEAEFEDEFPGIFNGTATPRLKEPLSLTLKLGGRQLASFDLNGTHLIQDCASVGAEIVRKLLTSYNREESLARDDGFKQVENGRVRPGLSWEPLDSIANKEQPSWASMRQQVVLLYVKAVSFTVIQNDLTPDRQEDLKARFPDVMVIPERSLCDHDEGAEIGAQFSANQLLRQRSTTGTASITALTTPTKTLPLNTSIVTDAEVVTDTLIANTMPKSSLLLRVSIGGSEMRTKSVTSGKTDKLDTSTDPGKTSPTLIIAERIGLEITSTDKFIHSMWSQWYKTREVKSFATMRRMLDLEQYYNNLVTLYILAYHKGEFDLCFAVLLRFQNTNYAFRGKLPDLATVVRAFQYLPEGNDLCRWVATLFAFLWGTQQYQNREHLLADFPGLDSDAFSKFIFAVAHTRDPFTKGHNTAVLQQWCAVHRHEEGDAEEALCMEVLGSMEIQLNKIRNDEAKCEYEGAKRLVNDHMKSVQLQSPSVDTTEGTPLGKHKRKAEGPVPHSNLNFKKGGGSGGFS